MDLQQMRDATRAFCKEKSTEAGALFPDDNVLLDFFLQIAADLVTLDIAKHAPDSILTYEDVSLVANTSNKTLTKEWLQIWSINRTQTGYNKVQIPYVELFNEGLIQTSGELRDVPLAWTRAGNSIIWMPTPSTNVSNFARVWLTPSESSIPETGPTYIPRIAHGLVPLQAMIYITGMLEADSSKWEKLYYQLLEKIFRTLGAFVQGQPKFVQPAVSKRIGMDSRDPTLYDKEGFFDTE